MKVLTTYLFGGAVALALSGVVRFLSHETEQVLPTEFDLGPADAVAPGQRLLFPQVPAVVSRGLGGFEALSLVCTHLGCTVEESTTGFECPCHGSLYDAKGSVVRGPASNPLKYLRTEITDDGHLLVHTD